MKGYRIGLLPKAREQLRNIFGYLAEHAGSDVAAGYVDSIVNKYNSIAFFPERGTPRPDLGFGHRSITHQRRCLIVYFVVGDEVAIAGIFYGGQDIAAAFDRS